MGVTPLHLQIALHYHVSGDGQWPMLHVPIHRQYANDLKEAGLLRSENGLLAGPVVGYEKTDGLAVWIEAILATPFPVLKWTMPKPPLEIRQVKPRPVVFGD